MLERGLCVSVCLQLSSVFPLDKDTMTELVFQASSSGLRFTPTHAAGVSLYSSERDLQFTLTLMLLSYLIFKMQREHLIFVVCWEYS